MLHRLTDEEVSHATLFARARSLLLSGDRAGADAAATRIEAQYGETPGTLWLRAQFALAAHDGGRALAMLDRLLARPAIDTEQRAEAGLLAGLALDLIGDAPAAFAAAAQGKALQRALHAEDAAKREDEVARQRRIARWLAASGPLPPLALPAAESAAATHVFLLGFPRSGTTLLEQILAAHPAVVALEEEATLAGAYQAFLSDADAMQRLATLDRNEAAAWAAHYWRGIRTRGLDVAGRVFVDKQPAGTLMLPVIARLFPHARVLFALRDPRDVVLSCFRQPFAMNAMTYAFTDLAETAWCYDACLTLAGLARQRLALAWADVRHEALVDDVEGAVARISDFLGLGPDPAMADFVRTANARTIRTPSAAQVRTGIDRRGIGRWQKFRSELAPVLPILQPWVERLGYPLDPGPP